jgi:gamma-glutamyl-gamma-aminobutyrate hydrolase PuuD
VKNLAPHFAIGTWVPDGVVQSIHKRSDGWVFGVKFHPDELVAGREEFMALFSEFAAQARASLRQQMAISASLTLINSAAKRWQSFMA